MIEKKYSLLSLMKTVTMFHIKHNNKTSKVVIMRPLSDEEEKQLEESNSEYGTFKFHLNNKVTIPGNNILLYGEVDLNNKDTLNEIEKSCYIPEDYDAHVHSNFDFEEGCFTTIDGIAKSYITYDPILWFKYNYCLIGKPKKIIIYKKYASH